MRLPFRKTANLVISMKSPDMIDSYTYFYMEFAFFFLLLDVFSTPPTPHAVLCSCAHPTPFCTPSPSPLTPFENYAPTYLPTYLHTYWVDT